MTIDLDDLQKELEKAKTSVESSLKSLKTAEELHEKMVQRVKMISALISIQQGGNGNA